MISLSILLLGSLIAAILCMTVEEDREPGTDLHLLRTQWADQVSPELPLPDYPRMQMRRDDWLSLNGKWRWQEISSFEEAGAAAEFSEEILVPFPIESQLSGVGRYVERFACRRTFRVPKDWNGRRVLLHFGAVNYRCQVWINGQKAGSHVGGYSPFSLDVTDLLKPFDQEQEITAAIENPVDSGPQPRGKQVKEPKSIFYTPCSGIWQTVWLEPVSAQSIESLRIVPQVGQSQLQVLVKGQWEGGHVQVQVLAEGRLISEARADAAGEAVLPIESPRLWSPDDPFLYDLKVQAYRGEEKVDEVASYAAMRSIEVAPDSAGTPRLLLNGKPLFQLGPLDQGYWPDGIYTAPTDEALCFDIEEVKKLGMNLIRKHAKTEPDRWYWHADRLGMLVWQDMPQGYDDDPPAEVRTQFKVELEEMVKSLWNHPSIIVWTPFNEGWGQHDTEAITDWLEKMDPSRLVNSASGWTDKNCGSFYDIHHYPEPQCPEPHGARALVLGEYGGIGCPVEGHLWCKGWSYMEVQDRRELTQTYAEYLQTIREFALHQGLCAAVYTQTTDVEQEINGLWTYDRAVLKFDRDVVTRENRETVEVLSNL